MDDAKKKLIEGVSLFLAFFVISFFLYINPDFIGSAIVTRSVGLVCGIIGLMGFMTELNNLRIENQEVKGAIQDMVMAVFLGVIIFVILYFTSHWIWNSIAIFLMLLAVYAAIRSIFKLIILTDFSNRSFILKIPVIVLNIAVFTLTVLQLLQIVKIIK